MPRGRKSQPAAIKEAKGNPGKRQIPTAEAEVADHPDKPPAWLTGVEEKKIWTFLRRELSRINLLKHTDQIAFGRYCSYVGMWIKAKKELARKKLTYETTSKHVGKMQRTNQTLLVLLRIEKAIVKLEEQLGLTPAARQGLLQRLAATPTLSLHPPQPSAPDGGATPDLVDRMSPVGGLGGGPLTKH